MIVLLTNEWKFDAKQQQTNAVKTGCKLFYFDYFMIFFFVFVEYYSSIGITAMYSYTFLELKSV